MKQAGSIMVNEPELAGFLLPKLNEHTFFAIASAVERFAHLGIQPGSVLAFDDSLPFEEGKPSCVFNLKTHQNRLESQLGPGDRYMGRLYAVISYFEG